MLCVDLVENALFKSSGDICWPSLLLYELLETAIALFQCVHVGVAILLKTRLTHH
jgi:hypothetical protein